MEREHKRDHSLIVRSLGQLGYERVGGGSFGDHPSLEWFDLVSGNQPLFFQLDCAHEHLGIFSFGHLDRRFGRSRSSRPLMLQNPQVQLAREPANRINESLGDTGRLTGARVDGRAEAAIARDAPRRATLSRCGAGGTRTKKVRARAKHE